MTIKKECNMTNTHHYNRNAYLAMRTGFFVLGAAVVVGGAATVFYSVKGMIYNPIFHWPAYILNTALGKTFLPVSTAEFTRLNNIPDYYSIGDMVIGATYLIGVSLITLYLIWSLGQYIALKVDDYCLNYKLGTEGAREYRKEQREKMKIEKAKSEAVAGLESAQHQHWIEWKKFYKSDLTYEEWKEKVIKGALYDGRK